MKVLEVGFPLLQVWGGVIVAMFFLGGCDYKPPEDPSHIKTATITLTVKGVGSVISEPEGISCPPTCESTFDKNSDVSLIASGSLDTNFAFWTGGCKEELTENCLISLDGDVTVEAIFSPALLAKRLDVSAISLSEGALFGFSISAIPDLDNDLKQDIIVGAPYQDRSSTTTPGEGKVYLFSGGTGLLVSTTTSLLATSTISHPVPQSEARFGYSVASMGDLDQDGIGDILVGAPLQDRDGTTTDVGEAYLISGKTGALLPWGIIAHPVPQASAQFGFSLSPISDMNGDSVNDFIVGANRQDVGSVKDVGEVYLFSGKTGTLLRTIKHPALQEGATFGLSVASVGDLSGDGLPEILVGAPFQDSSTGLDQGAAYLFSGATGNLFRTITHPAPQATARFGSFVMGSGDLDGDSVADYLVSAPLQDVGGNSNQGAVFVFSGKTGNLLRRIDLPIPQPGAFFGSSIAVVPDLNGDGFPEILIGAPGMDIGGTLAAGMALLYSGHDGALIATISNPNPEQAAQFANPVASIGDISGDGKADILIGAPFQDGTGTNQEDRGAVLIVNSP
ncbi:MAG: FG-GAP repeat protein [Nitrospirae bacterium]|nr:FG-GAP repeat protein [Candidatus Troglogloeales bacterium]